MDQRFARKRLKLGRKERGERVEKCTKERVREDGDSCWSFEQSGQSTELESADPSARRTITPAPHHLDRFREERGQNSVIDM